MNNNNDNDDDDVVCRFGQKSSSSRRKPRSLSRSLDRLGVIILYRIYSHTSTCNNNERFTLRCSAFSVLHYSTHRRRPKVSEATSNNLLPFADVVVVDRQRPASTPTTATATNTETQHNERRLRLQTPGLRDQKSKGVRRVRIIQHIVPCRTVFFFAFLVVVAVVAHDCILI